MTINKSELQEMRERAEAWTKPIPGGTGAAVTRENAINEENMALDVLDLLSYVAYLEDEVERLNWLLDGGK